jgi:hypothetical protein
VGWGSDLRLIREVFPGTPISIEIQAKVLVGASPQELDRMVMQLVVDAAPVERITHLWVAEAGPEVSDEVVHHLATWPQRHAHMPANEFAG